MQYKTKPTTRNKF